MTKRHKVDESLTFGLVIAIGEIQECVQVHATTDYLNAVFPDWCTARLFRDHEHP